MATTTGLTIEDYERLPDAEVEGHELVDGELVPVNTGVLRQNRIRDRFIVLLSPIVFDQEIGTVVAEQQYDFAGHPHGPDVSFYRPEKEPFADPLKRVQRFVPDFAIEIVSTYDTASELWRKKDRYRACGTEEVWIVFPESWQILVFSKTGDRILNVNDELSTPLIPGFRVTMEGLFRGICPPPTAP